ncbi:MAG: hypothetical protein IPM42_06530 [Saprospiraceae bacterium]|nr:hypothetical protein [Saprospiraceae bacterium]
MNIEKSKMQFRNILPSLIIGFLALIIIFQLIQSNRMNEELTRLRSGTNMQETQAGFSIRRLQADSLFIFGERELALDIYKSEYEAGLLSKDFYERIKLYFPEQNINENEVSKELISEKELIKMVRNQSNLVKTYSHKYDELLRTHIRLQDSLDKVQKNYESGTLAYADTITHLKSSKYGELEFKSSKDEKVLFFGEIKSNQANGYGLGIWSSGGIYRGDWKNNMRQGNGVYIWKDGEKYEGAYLNDKRNGIGKYVWKNGLYFVGSWKDDKRHGEGILYEKNGTVRTQGVWSEDNLNSKK